MMIRILEERMAYRLVALVLEHAAMRTSAALSR